jgi:hypothetical protein
MAITQGAWSEKIVNGVYVATCTVSGTDDTDLMTKRTPDNFDGSYPFSLVVYLSEDMTAAGASAVDIWGCTSDLASLAITDAGTDCYLVQALSGDLDAGGTQVTHVFPALGGNGGGTFTQVVNSTTLNFALLPAWPHYIFNVDMTAGLQDAASVVFTVIQKTDKKGI